MQAQQQIEKPVRIGVFGTLEAADRAVDALVRSGFTRDEMSVLAPESMETHFGPLAEQSANEKSSEGIVTGSTIGAALGSLALIAGVVTTGGVGILAAGALGLGLGGVVGGLVGAMGMRGVQKEYADFYDQALTRGRILVAVESPDTIRLGEAERILAHNGAQPVALPEG